MSDPSPSLPPQQPANDRPFSFGLAAVGASLGVQAMLVLLIHWGPIPLTHRLVEFTYHVRSLVRPERDLQLYAIGICVSLLLIWGLASIWKHRRSNLGSSLSNGSLFTLAVIGLAIFLLLVHRLTPPDDRREVISLPKLLAILLPTIMLIGIAFTPAIDVLVRLIKPALPGLAIAIVVASLTAQQIHHPLTLIILLVSLGIAACFSLRASIPWHRLLAIYSPAAIISLIVSRCAGGAPAPAIAFTIAMIVELVLLCRALPQARSIPVLFIVDLLTILFLFSVVFIPHRFWPALAGSMFQKDELHHWNYFAFGPALAFAHHQTLAMGVFAQYGCAWSWLFATFRKIAPLTYANVIGLSASFGSLYFVLLFLFLRTLLESWGWATTGALLAIVLQIFSGVAPSEFIWNYPSSTLLRHPIDVFVFMAMLAHHRRQSDRWLFIIGALVGLAALFELDTGIHLAIVSIFFWWLDCLRRGANHWLSPLRRWIHLRSLAVTIL
ncbi:MAG: hypothetical protein JO353_12290, partial [Phycisphaerae bacterium]|nr:hypothetical protein [Phycisphaerae bacterium]